MAELTETLVLHLKAAGIKDYEREYRFTPTRRFRFDIAFVKQKLAIECDGATWIGGRHTRGAGYEKDCEKLNLAVQLGWRPLRFTSAMVKSGAALKTIEACLGN